MDRFAQTDDKELFQLIAGGDKLAFTQLFKKYTPQLTGFISQLTRSEALTDEIVQEIFMRVWLDREKLPDVSDPKSHIFRVAAVVCYASLKPLLTENRLTNMVQHQFQYDNNEIFEHARFYRLAADIQNAVKKLTPQQKQVYRLNREKGLKVPEIAQELSFSPNNVRNLLNSSVGSIHDQLQHKGHSF